MIKNNQDCMLEINPFLDSKIQWYFWFQIDPQTWPEIEHVPCKNMFLQKQHLLFYLQIVRVVETRNIFYCLTLYLTLSEIEVQKWRIRTKRSVVIFDLDFGQVWPQNLEFRDRESIT